MEIDHRRWHVSKEIPIALIVSIACSLFLGGIAYQSLKGDQSRLAERQVDFVKRQEATDAKLDTLTRTVQDGGAPSAVNASRIGSLEITVSELKGRVSENERQIARIQSAQVTTDLRNRASRER